MEGSRGRKAVRDQTGGRRGRKAVRDQTGGGRATVSLAVKSLLKTAMSTAVKFLS